MRYTHQLLDRGVEAAAGYYCPQKEVRMEYEGREVLYVLGHVNIENSCCGLGCWVYAQIPGFIVRWQSENDESGVPVSEVELITDNETRTKISKIIRNTEMVSRIDFW